MRTEFVVLVVSFLALAFHPPVQAQPLDELGNRAAAMGAFVAVADDASAVAWNPAGLINGPIFNFVLDFGQSTIEPDADPALSTRPAGRVSSTFLAAAVLPLGISYSRTRLTELSPAAQPLPDRQDGQLSVRSLMLSQLGITVLQSVVEGVTVGATAKLVRGSYGLGTATAASWEEGFELAEMLDAEGKTTADVDVGVLAGAGRVRVGLVARNLAAPTFESAGESITVDRQVRIGAAWGDGWPGIPRLIVSIDADLTRVDRPGGERRDIAVGAERWFRGQRIGVRGGLRASTVEETRPVASAGASYAVRNGVFIDVYAAAGREADRRWGIAGRLSY
jgi:F plasmid transfer operon, TraF, protein